PGRQQTMAAASDWSHRVLSADDATMCRRLAVFQGGFAREAAQSVCSDPGGHDVLGVLTGLVQKSMVEAERLEDGSTRFRLLESHHDYALEKIHESGEIQSLQRRHCEYLAGPTWHDREAAHC